ncbi:hypothetical protein IP267_004438, partial [Salmonella enterica]|nr:hypothetical protein [Salmonella enterica subsp. enterica serovar Dublin]EGL1924763.1 hypothetical protein [Salmonella enterica]
MFSLWVKWPEKAVSESSRGLAQLSFLVQVERAACVTFPLCAVKVTHRTGAGSENLSLVQFYDHAAVKPLSLQAAARKVKGAEGVSRYKLAGIIPAQCRFRPAGWRSKRTYRVKTQASVAMFCDPMFAEVCTGKRTNRPDNRRFFQVAKRWALSTTAWSRRETMPVPLAQKGKTVFASKRLFANTYCRASLCLLPSFRLQMQAEDRECRFCFSGVCSRVYTYYLPS